MQIRRNFMNQKLLRTVLAMMFCFIGIMAATVVSSAESVPDYDASKAISYAANHCGDSTEADGTKSDCIEFARTCVQKGGVPKDSSRVRKNGTGYTVADYIDYMVDNGYAELNKLTVEKVTFANGSGPFYYINSETNKGKVAPGDIFIYKCSNSSCSKTFFHASICAAADTEGTYANYYRCYAHNMSVDNRPVCAIPCNTCKTDESKTEMYALHITSKDNGFSNYADKVTVKVTRSAYNKLKVSWNAADGASKYNVFYKKKQTGFFKKLTTTSGTSAVYNVPKNEYAGTIYFAVRPCKNINGQEYVGAISNTGSNYTIASKPQNLKITLTAYRNVKVTWSKASGATGYKVEYKRPSDKKWSFLTWTTGTSAKRTNLAAGKKYYFRITPYTTSALYTGKRISTNYAEAATYTLKRISLPTVKRVSSTKVRVKWNNISGETGYQISKATSKSKTKVVATYKTTTGNFKVLKAPKGKTYYYKVRAYKEVNGKKIYGPWSSVKTFK